MAKAVLQTEVVLRLTKKEAVYLLGLTQNFFGDIDTSRLDPEEGNWDTEHRESIYNALQQTGVFK